MSKIRSVALLSVFLLASSASAQPVFYLEHHWILHLGQGAYGLVQHRESVGGRCTTTVWVGRAVFYTSIPAPELLLVTSGALVAAGVIAGISMRRYQAKPGPA
jgi:hypothetical protein